MAARAAPWATPTVVLSIVLGLPAVRADGLPPQPGMPPQPGILSPGRTFSEETGESLYRNVCQGCHMADGRGATGAGRYPSLADNDDLASGGYVATVVVRGLRGMPGFGRSMSDLQVAAVVNYVRTRFGKAGADPVTAADVADTRR